MRYLFAAEAVSQCGNWFNTIALLGLVYSRTSSPVMVSLLLVASSLPALLLSPFLGVMIDRWDKKRVMIATDLIRAGLVLTLLSARSHLWIVFPAQALLSVAAGLFTPARQAAIPMVVEGKDVAAANAFSSMLWGGMAALGAALGGLVSAWVGYDAAFVLDSLSFVASALLIGRVVIPPRWSDAAAVRPLAILDDVRAGYRFVRGNAAVLGLILAGISWGIVGGAYYVLLPIYGSGVFSRGSFGIGALYAVDGLGVLLGGLLASRFEAAGREGMLRAFGWAYLAQGVFFGGFVCTRSLLPGAALLLAMRLAGGVIIPLDATLLQLFSPETVRGRVFSLHSATYGFCMQFSMLLSGLLLARAEPRAVGLGFAALCVLVSAVWLVAFRRSRSA